MMGSPEQKTPRRYLLKTLGCKANLYDSQLIEAELQKRGWVPAAPDAEDADLCIVNSCTVTNEADQQSRKMAKRLSRDNPTAKVVMTGCSAEVDPGKLATAKGIDFVVSNRDKPRLMDLVLEALTTDAAGVLGKAVGYGEMLSRHPIDREWPATESAFQAPPVGLESGASHRTRAFLKIQDGCNSFCTYCVIPYGRGPSRSLKIPEVVAQVNALVAQGVREVVITGINIGDYGMDWCGKLALTELFEAIFAKTALERLRVSSLDPSEIDDGLIALMRREPRFCPHFHVSLQSPHSRILRLMKRKYGNAEVESCLEKISRIPGGAFVGMDVITGFPGETEEEFEETRAMLSRLPWSRLHVFPYSEREGTPATRLPSSVKPEERARRARILRELSLERMREQSAALLKSCRDNARAFENILVESPTRGPDGTDHWYSGYTRDYRRVLIKAPASGQSLTNQLVTAHPESLIVDSASGEVGFVATQAF